MIPVFYWVILLLAVIFYPWPNSPWVGWPWGPHILYIVLFILLGIAVFGLGVGRI